jgi:hypothetical protein
MQDPKFTPEYIETFEAFEASRLREGLAADALGKAIVTDGTLTQFGGPGEGLWVDPNQLEIMVEGRWFLVTVEEVVV